MAQRNSAAVQGYNVKSKIAPDPNAPKLENDTLFTSSGYKMYPGKILHIGVGTGKGKGFRFLKDGTSYGSYKMAGATVLIEKVSDLRTSTVGNMYIFIRGRITFKDGSQSEITLNIAFDNALEDRPALPSELIVPDEFKHKEKESPADELTKLYKLYQDSAINKEEFDAAKAKILAQ